MNTDFENSLQRRPLRELPSHWRSPILAAAQAPAARWSDWFWPHPRAWAALGLAWCAIILFHFATPADARLNGASFSPAPLSDEARLERARLMAQLLGPTDAETPVSPALPPKPRSERTRREMIV